MGGVKKLHRISGDLSSSFESHRGLRQGDGLSCLLFNTALEGAMRRLFQSSDHFLATLPLEKGTIEPTHLVSLAIRPGVSFPFGSRVGGGIIGFIIGAYMCGIGPIGGPLNRPFEGGGGLIGHHAFL